MTDHKPTPEPTKAEIVALGKESPTVRDVLVAGALAGFVTRYPEEDAVANAEYLAYLVLRTRLEKRMEGSDE